MIAAVLGLLPEPSAVLVGPEAELDVKITTGVPMELVLGPGLTVDIALDNASGSPIP
jgi:hypothetical protein